MQEDVTVGFWSYAHEDDRLDDGAILKLAQLVADEFEILSGESLKLFVDRNDIAWGEVWRERVDSALTQTTFLIPIVTPRYFTRPECRKELLEFAAKARGLGVDELILPILYVAPVDFSADNPDEAVRLIAKTQYADWQKLRFVEPASREFRKAVNDLAQRLLEIALKVIDDQFDREINSDLDAEGAEGIADLVDRITRLLPEWMEAVLGDRVVDAQIKATFSQCMKPVVRLEKAHAPASAVLAAKSRAVRELIPIIERSLRDARTYLALSVQLDPAISSLARKIREHPGNYELAMPIRDAIDEAMENIKRADERLAADPPMHKVVDHLESWRHLGRVFQKCYRLFKDDTRTIIEANEIVRRWDAELERMTSTDPSSRIK